MVRSWENGEKMVGNHARNHRCGKKSMIHRYSLHIHMVFFGAPSIHGGRALQQVQWINRPDMGKI